MLTVRIGDVAIGLCPCPPAMCMTSGIVASGSFGYIEGTSPLARMGDIVLFPCGGFIITMGAFPFIEAGLPATQIGASCVGAGTGMITSGSFQHLEA